MFNKLCCYTPLAKEKYQSTIINNDIYPMPTNHKIIDTKKEAKNAIID
jgi:hypothetical protein